MFVAAAVARTFYVAICGINAREPVLYGRLKRVTAMRL